MVYQEIDLNHQEEQASREVRKHTMAQNPSISFTNSKGVEYKFILGGPADNGLAAFVIIMFAFILLGSLIISISGFALGNLIAGFIGLALFISPFAVIAFASKIHRN